MRVGEACGENEVVHLDTLRCTGRHKERFWMEYTGCPIKGRGGCSYKNLKSGAHAVQR